VKAIMWFTRDLRVHDNPALSAALDGGDHEIVPVFCFDDRILHGRHASGPRTQFMLKCLADLDAALRERGAQLVVRHGRPEDELPKLGGDVIHCMRDTTPFARRRLAGLPVIEHPGLLIAETEKPYVVFSPFHRAWEREPRREVLHAPRKIRLPKGIDPGRLPMLDELGLEQELDNPTPRLSAHLHFGTVSPLDVERRSPHLSRNLAWRDFFHQVLLHHPENQQQEFQERYRGTLDWNDDPDALAAWKQGRTGFPFVDAGMRQLAREGWIPNHVRLVVASFLIKQLGIDWREGERHFMRLLLDGDEANNNGNWQWIASVGVDPAPYFRRLYNPARQQERHDPSGEYVRRYVPELGTADYPEPIVDQREAREEAIARYKAAAGSAA
jgi:deoxyribodipyrimidine photo-lyase